MDGYIKVNNQLTKVDFITNIEMFLEQMHGYSSDLSGYIMMTGLRHAKSDLDLSFKVIVLYVGCLLNQWMDFLQTYINVPLEQAYV